MSQESCDDNQPLVDQTWNAADSYLDTFRIEWDRGKRPSIEEHVIELSGAQRHEVLATLIRFEMEQRLQAGKLVRLEEFLQRFPDLADEPVTLSKLILSEYLLRQSMDEHVSIDEFAKRFPDQVGQLGCDLGITSDNSDLPSSTNSTVGNVDTSEVPSKLGPGVIIGEFEIVGSLGAGGSGEVFLARQPSLDRLVALKVSLNFHEEGTKLAAVEHEHIVPVFAEQQIGKWHVLAMRYIPGITLSHLMQVLSLENRKTLTRSEILNLIEREVVEPQPRSADEHGDDRTSFVDTICGFILNLSRALDYVHGRGLLHRDIKPDNILLTTDGRAMLIDFNVAVRREQVEANREQMVGGTLAYMSPEHLAVLSGAGTDNSSPTSSTENVPSTAEVSKIDASSDVYSLGIVFFEALTGRRPFHFDDSGTSMIATAQAVLAERLQGAPDFPSNGRQVPAALRPIVLKCLATRSDRYESAGQLATDLNRYINHSRLQYASEQWKDRFTLWMRRHPTATVVLIVTAILGSFLTWLDYYLESHRLAQFKTIAISDSRQIQSFPHKPQSIAKSHTELFSRDSFIPFSGLEKKRARLLNQFAANRLAAATAEWKASQSSGNNINKSNTETKWNFVVTSCRLAIQECDQALRCDSTLGDAYFQRAESRFMLAELRHDQVGTTVANRLFDQALTDYKLAMTHGVDEALVLAHRAPCRFILGSPCAALDDLHKSLKINPTLQQAIDIRNMMRAAWNQGVRTRFTSQEISLEEYCQEKRTE